MMRPEDIQNRDFLVGLRGYDKDEVRSFLLEVASEHAALLVEVEEARVAPAPALAPEPVAAEPAVNDDFENLGASVAAILRTAKQSAEEMTSDAEARANQVRAEAEELRSRAADEAYGIRRQAAAEADELKGAAQSALHDAHAEAERILRDANERAREIEMESEANVNARLEEATRHEASMRSRLLEASDELQLALLSLGEPTAAPEHVDFHESQPVEDEAAGWS